jgi:hypothetical protein
MILMHFHIIKLDLQSGKKLYKIITNLGYESFGFLTAVTMMFTVPWDVALYTLVDRDQCFGKTCSLFYRVEGK